MGVDLEELRYIAYAKYMARAPFEKQLRDRDNYLSKLIYDTYTIRNVLKGYILQRVVNRLSRSADIENGVEFKLWNIDTWIDSRELALYLNIKPSIYFTGFWNRKTRLYNKKDWDNANIGLMVEELNNVLSPITLTNISDRKLSRQLVLLCTVPAVNQPLNNLELRENPVFYSEEELMEQKEDKIRKVCSIS